jgi:dTDP-4-amino-4,6-dideoxygalactose transaminase
MTSLPALLGGAAVRPQGPPDWPLPDDDVSRALHAALADGAWGKYLGPNVPRLETRLQDYFGIAFGLTCGSGTFAVELALRALKIGPGDEVLLSAYDYPGNFLCVHAVGAKPVLVDVEPGDWNLSLAALDAAYAPTVRAVIASHLHGGLIPMRELTAWAAAKRVRVVEDAAQAPGAVVQGKKAGTWGDAGVLSFGGSKLLTSGRGGALLTPHADVHQRARLWLQRGNHICPLAELQAAVLVPQIDRLDARNAQRARAVAMLSALLRDVPGIRPFARRDPADAPAYYKIGLQYDSEAFGLPRETLIAAARAEGIALDAGFPSLHRGRSPTRFRKAGALAEADRAHDDALVLHHPVLLGSDAELAQVGEALQKIHAHVAALQDQA